VIGEFPNSRIDVIILRRFLPKALKSLIELGHFSGNPATRNWIPDMNSVNRAHRPCLPFPRRSPSTNNNNISSDVFDRLIVYLIDIEARAFKFQQQHSNNDRVRIIEARQEEITTLEGVRKLFNSLEIDVTDETERFVGSVVNLRKKRQTQVQRHRIRRGMSLCHQLLLTKLSRNGYSPPTASPTQPIVSRETEGKRDRETRDKRYKRDKRDILRMFFKKNKGEFLITNKPQAELIHKSSFVG